MTTQKKLKKNIRARAAKTGESYTAARRQVLARRNGAPPPSPPARPAAVPAAAVRRSGSLTEARVLAKTGHGLAHWFSVLDAFDAPRKGHTAAARLLHEQHGVPGWYAQGITVEYERERGVRAVNQAASGKFQVSVSKAIRTSVREAADALAIARRRATWLAGADRALRDALEAALSGPRPRTVTVRDDGKGRLRYKWDGSTVEVHIASKPSGGCTVVVANTDLPQAALVEPRREKWRAALAALQAYLQR